jgi:hypothetical protein
MQRESAEGPSNQLAAITKHTFSPHLLSSTTQVAGPCFTVSPLKPCTESHGA